ncbi:molybdate metabolism regulator [Aeoliella mucimassa]|uniref:Uncharacterized protein n=1 Tax=Aeoliella mucimassa TaxID=2527972 RepID=A0A518AH09_9BACT|nr:molybdate metabolism regulator [Aeoliella mucimassa]QDU54020.1 hypothetical protein Pan181_02000 [Aeoliella mucimassa]
MCDEEHDPFNEPELAHPRARELMTDNLFWDCADEGNPFGSDEGFDAYYEWRRWRNEHPTAPLTECFDWILMGQLAAYNDSLTTPEQIAKDLANPEGALLADSYDLITLDTTMIATGLGQLLDEGKIDIDAKKYLKTAITRQRYLQTGPLEESTLDVIERVVEAA